MAENDIDDFLDDYPTVTKEQAIGNLLLAGKLFFAQNSHPTL